MAKILEFHIPESFSNRSKSLPPSGLGKVLEFSTRDETQKSQIHPLTEQRFPKTEHSEDFYGAVLH